MKEPYRVSQPARILLLDDTFDLTSLEGWKGGEYHAVICLFWVAPSTKQALSRKVGGSCYGLTDIVGSDMTWGRTTYGMVTTIAHGGPLFKALPWRTYLTERIYGECRTLQLFIMVPKFIETLVHELAVSEITIDSLLGEDTGSFLSGILSNYPGWVYNRLMGFSKSPEQSEGKNSIICRFGKRLREISLTGGFKSQTVDLIEWMDKTCRVRAHIGGWRSHPKISKGGITFFSSYLNNSRILSSFVDLMPSPVSWVLTNGSSRRGLCGVDLDYSWIWQFHGSQSFHQKVIDKWAQHEDGFHSKDVDLAKAWVTVNPTWRQWQSTELSLLATLTNCWETYLKEAEPRLVATANQWGVEGWVAQIAKRHHVPVLQIMHGALGGYLHTQTPIISDLMVVPGNFWRELWPEDQRRKIVVHNPGGHIKKVRRKTDSQKRCATFFSWPLMRGTFYNFSEFVDGFIQSFHKILLKEKYKVIVRAHPLENPQDFVKRWRYLKGAVPSTLCISKHEPLDGVLSETDVALMFRSTVMLDCLANNIPVVMPGWIDFGWNEALTDVPNIYLAHDFIDLEQRLLVWLQEPPEASEEVARHFVHPPGEDQSSFLSLLNELVSAGQRA